MFVHLFPNLILCLIMCMKRFILGVSRFLNIHCQKYLLDYEKEKMYQFFDSPKYSSNITITEIENTTTASQENNNNSLGSSRDFYHLV